MLHPSELSIQLTQQTVFLMGISFLLGSLCTIFILVILEMVRSNHIRPKHDDSESI